MDQVIAFRRHLHRHPELSFREEATRDYILARLEEVGIEARVVAKTGVLATIRGRHTAPEERRAIVLRADIDALPINEQSGLKFASENAGVMHACGHDMHAAVLYGVLCRLAANPDFEGTIFGLFQPGEECNPGGASEVLSEHPFEGYDIRAVVGEHCEWQLEVGQIGLKGGKYMASSDELHFTVRGRGGHGAMRHLLIDPVVAAAELITRLTAFNSDEQVLSIGLVRSEGATNVIPDSVTLAGTLRTFDEENRQALHRQIVEIASTIDQTHHTTIEVDINHGYPAVVNDEKLVEAARSEVEALGYEATREERRPLAEDFGYYTLHYPALFYRLGVGRASGRSHTATYAPSEEALTVGVELMARLAKKLIQR